MKLARRFIGLVILFAGRLRCDWTHIISFPHFLPLRLSGNSSVSVVLTMAARSNISEAENFFTTN